MFTSGEASGGAIFLNPGSLIMLASTIVDAASVHGGSVWMNGQLKMFSSSIVNSLARGWGGAINIGLGQQYVGGTFEMTRQHDKKCNRSGRGRRSEFPRV
jgi:hypothetical protein